MISLASETAQPALLLRDGLRRLDVRSCSVRLDVFLGLIRRPRPLRARRPKLGTERRAQQAPAGYYRQFGLAQLVLERSPPTRSCCLLRAAPWMTSSVDRGPLIQRRTQPHPDIHAADHLYMGLPVRVRGARNMCDHVRPTTRFAAKPPIMRARSTQRRCCSCVRCGHGVVDAGAQCGASASRRRGASTGRSAESVLCLVQRCRSCHPASTRAGQLVSSQHDPAGDAGHVSGRFDGITLGGSPVYTLGRSGRLSLPTSLPRRAHPHSAIRSRSSPDRITCRSTGTRPVTIAASASSRSRIYRPISAWVPRNAIFIQPPRAFTPRPRSLERELHRMSYDAGPAAHRRERQVRHASRRVRDRL